MRSGTHSQAVFLTVGGREGGEKSVHHTHNPVRTFHPHQVIGISLDGDASNAGLHFSILELKDWHCDGYVTSLTIQIVHLVLTGQPMVQLTHA